MGSGRAPIHPSTRRGRAIRIVSAMILASVTTVVALSASVPVFIVVIAIVTAMTSATKIT